MTVRKEDTSPLYEQVMERLSARISEGEYLPEEQIPNEMELCAEFGVSRITVRRAVEELCKKGLLEKKQGKGTFVALAGGTIDFREVSSFHGACRRMGLRASTRLIHAKLIPADRRDTEELKLSGGQRVVEILRVQSADGVPVMVENNHFSSAYSYLTECDLEGSLYGLLREFGVEAKNAVHDISICSAEALVAGWLNVPKGTKLLYLREVILDQKGRPLHNSEQWIRGDMFTFRI